MPAERTIASLRLWVAQHNAIFLADEDLGRLINGMRGAMAQANDADIGELSLQLAIGLDPATKALRAGKGTFADAAVLGEALYECYKVVVSHTRLPKKYATSARHFELLGGLEPGAGVFSRLREHGPSQASASGAFHDFGCSVHCVLLLRADAAVGASTTARRAR